MSYWIIGTVIVVALIVYFIVNKYSKVKNGENIANTVDRATDIAEDIVSLFIFEKNIKDIAHALDLVDYVAEEVGKVIDADDKAAEIHAVLKEVFAKLEYAPNENEQGLINIVVDEALRFIDKEIK